MPVRNPIEIGLQDEWIDQADAFKLRVDRKKTAAGMVTRRFDASTDADIGWLGERVVYEFFKSLCDASSSADCHWLNQDDEKFAPYDLQVHTETGILTVDVKSAKPVRYTPQECRTRISTWSYLYPVTQKPLEKDYVALVYVFKPSRLAMIVGFIEGAVIASCPQKEKAVEGPAEKYIIPNYDIRPIAEKFIDPSDFVRSLGL